MRTGKHDGVQFAMATVKLFGAKLDVYVYFSGGVLVDTGPSRFGKVLKDFFTALPVKKVVLTHFHEDHSGNAPFLAARGVPVYIHPASRQLCRHKAALPLYRRFFWGPRQAFDPLPLGDSVSGDGKSWKVIETPGHAHDHVVFYDREAGALFTGDLFVSPKTKLIMRTESIHQTMASLRKILQLDFQTVYCGHAGVVENGRELLTLKLQYLEELAGRIRELYRRGLDIKAIEKKLFPQRAPLALISGGEWSSLNIVRSVVKEECQPAETDRSAI